MKKLGTFLFLSILFLFAITTANIAQVSPDYIFGDDNGSGWNFTTGTAGTAGLGSTYKWQFLSTATTNHSIKFGETNLFVDGSGFWQNNAGVSVQYTGAGAMQTAYYNINTLGLGAIYWAITTGNYYVVKVVKKSGVDAYFAVFDNGAQAPRTITAMSKSYNNPDLWVFVSLSGAKSANEKVWVRYTTDNWVTSSTVEADLDISGGSLTNWQAEIPLAGGEIVKYYAFTTIQQAAAPAEADADFFAVNYNNNSGVNYTYMNGSMTGTYYIGNAGTGPGGSDPEFQYLTQACDALNTSTISGNCTLYITSDLTESLNSGLGVNTAGHSITFKPSADADRTITFTKSTDNGASSGGLVIGLSNVDSWASLVITNNIIIDGYAEGGSARRLSLVSSALAHTTNTPIHIIGDVNDLTIKNCILTVSQTTGTSAFGPISMRSGRWSSVDYLCDNIIVDNCIISSTTPSGAGIFVSYTSSGGGAIPTGRPTGLEFKNNTISVKHRAVSLNYSGTCSVYNNQISVNQPATGFASFGIGGASAGLITTNVYNNRIIQLGTGNIGGAANGIRGIQASAGGTWNIYNNFITGFSTPASGTTELLGIRAGSASNIYYNTIVMNDVTTTGGGTQATSGIVNFSASSNISNNIIMTEEDGFVNYCIYGSTLPATSDYNNFYRSGTTNAKIGYSAGAQATLSDWQIASSKDANSVSKAVNLVSSTDLHLTGQSVGDFTLAGTPLIGYTTDLDGDTRSTSAPYMGADENLNVPLATSYKRPVDADAADWTGTASGTLHASVVSSEEAIYTGETVDARTDQNGGDGGWINNDITEFRFTRDNSYLYFMVKFNDIDNINRPYVAIGIDANQSDDTPVWLGDDSPTSLVPATNRAWERQLAFHATTDGVLDIEMFADDGISWYAPPSNYEISGSMVNEVIEGRVALYDLGINTTSTLKLAVATFNNNTFGYNNVIDATTGSFIDVITPGYSGSNNAWFRAGESNSDLNSNVSWDQALNVLPVELTSLTALVKGTSVNISWKTATEVNSYAFEIERTLSDAQQWEKITVVNAHGNSNAPVSYSYTDENLNAGKYSYRLKMIDNDGSYAYSAVAEASVEQPNEYVLQQNYPNPFNPVTTIQYSLPVESDVMLQIYSINGELVTTLVNEKQPQGAYNVDFNASGYASGTYIYRLIAGSFVQTKKMILLK